MKQVELNAMMEQGEQFILGTYLSGSLDEVSVRDKSNPGGARRTSHVAREIIVTKKEPIVISRWLRDTEKATDWKPASSPGSKVVVHKIISQELSNGIKVMNATVEPLVA